MKWIIPTLLLAFIVSAADKLPPGKVNTMVEALSRLDPAVVNGNERLKSVLNQVLDATGGEPRLVGLVKKFGVKGREADLLDVAAKHPADPAGVQALAMVLGGEGQKAKKLPCCTAVIMLTIRGQSLRFMVPQRIFHGIDGQMILMVNVLVHGKS